MKKPKNELVKFNSIRNEIKEKTYKTLIEQKKFSGSFKDFKNTFKGKEFYKSELVGLRSKKEVEKIQYISFESQLKRFNKENKGLKESTIKRKFSRQFKEYLVPKLTDSDEYKSKHLFTNGLDKKEFYGFRKKVSKALSNNKKYAYKPIVNKIQSDETLSESYANIMASDALEYDTSIDYNGGLIILEFLESGSNTRFYSIPVNARELKDIEVVRYKIENWREFISIRKKESGIAIKDLVLKSIDIRLYPKEKTKKKRHYKQLI